MSLKASSIDAGGDVVVPGSVANLGGGFDTLGVAVQLYLRARIVDIRDDASTKLVVTRSVPAVKGQNALERAFDAIARRTGLRTPAVFVEVESDGTFVLTKHPNTGGVVNQVTAALQADVRTDRFLGRPTAARGVRPAARASMPGLRKKSRLKPTL